MQRVLGGLQVDLQGGVAQLGGAVGAHQLDDSVEGDVLVVFPKFGLAGRREERLGELAGLGQALGQLDATHLAGLAVVDQPGPGQVAAGDALDGHHVQPADHQRPAEHLCGDALVVGRAGEVVGPSRKSKKNTLIAVRMRPLSGIALSRT